MGKAPDYPYPFIDEVLYTKQNIQNRVIELGKQITEDYKNSEQLLLLGLLRGSVMFITDLMREIQMPLTMDFMSVSSYSGDQSSGWVRIDSDHKTSIAGWDVILIDDIVVYRHHDPYSQENSTGTQTQKPANLRSAG